MNNNLPSDQHDEQKISKVAGPKCPSCQVEGIEYFASSESREQAKNKTPWFIVIYCNQCGHVHQSIAKHVFTSGQSPFVMPNLK